MNRKEFDKILGDKLRNSEAPVNPEIWNNIANALETEKKIGFLPWFSANMVLVFCLAGLGVAGAFYYRNEIKHYIKTDKIANLNVGQNFEANDVTNTSINTNSSIELTPKTEVTKYDETATIKDIDPKPSVGFHNNANSSVRSSQIKNLKPNIRNTNKNIENNKNSLNQISPVLENVNIKENSNTNNVINSYAEETLADYSIASIPNKLPLNSFAYLNPGYDNAFSMSKVGPKKRPKCPRFYSTAPRYSFTFYGGPNLLTKRLTVDNKEFAGLKPARELTESSLVGSTFGFYADVTFRNKFILRSGLNYFIAREKFRFVKEGDQILKSKVIVSDTIQGTDGKTYLQLDTLFYTESGTRVRQSVNSFRVVEMPLLAGIQFDYGRWYGTVIGGLLLQLYQFNEGLILDQKTIEPVAYSSTSNQIQYFRNSWGLGLYASLQLGYRLSDAYSFIFEPNIRYYPGNIHVDGYPLVQTNTIIGSNLGIRYSF